LVGTNITGTASGLTAGTVTTNANLTGMVTSVGNATTVVTNANLTGAVTSSGNATSLGSFSSANLLAALTDETGTGSAVFATSPTLVTPILGTPTSATLTNATGLPLTTGVTGQLPVANGGTGTATPSIVAGTNVTVTGTWPNQTIAASGGGGTPGGSTTQVQYNNAGAFGGITGATTNGTALTLVAPLLGTPASGVATNLTGLPLTTGVTGTLPTANGGTGLTSFTSGGVVYASSSSALATGSALSFNGTTALTVGTGSAATTLGGSTSTAGGLTDKDLTVSAWFPTSGTNEYGGDLYLSAGRPIGNGTGKLGSVYLKVGVGNATGNAAGTLTTALAAALDSLIFSTSSAERARIDASGNLGIGTSSPATRLHVVTPSDTPITGESTGGTAYFVYKNNAGAAGIASTGNNLVLFTSTSGTERARIDSSGRFIVGASSASGSNQVEIQTNLTNGLWVQTGSTSGSNYIVDFRNGSNTPVLQALANNTVSISSLGTGIVYSNGGILTSTNPSDERLKTDIENLSWGLTDILALRPVSYKWKSDKIEQGKQYGFIAQEVQSVMPELIREFETPDGTRYGLEKEGIYATMVKAIQEQQALITQLQADVATLKGN
jgi:hypothetical protein